MEEYRSGRLGYVNYTLFWADQPVDTAETYADFSKDRKERLDRYAEEYGTHWLYFESPLWSHAESKPRLALCAIVNRDITWSTLGCYLITQASSSRCWILCHLTAFAEYATDR